MRSRPVLATALLWLLFVAHATPHALAADPYEPNDTLATAAPIAAGLHVAAITAGDDDFYLVALGPDEALDVRLLFTHAAGDLDLKIYAPEGHVLASSISTTDDEVAYWYPRAAAPTTLVVHVTGYLGATNDYVLDVRLLPHGGLPLADDHLEENDDADHATPLGRGARFDDLAWLDEDWFRLDVATHDTVRATLAFRDAMGDLDLELLDAGLVRVAASRSATDDERIVAPFLGEGAYFLRVFSEEEGARNHYALEVEVAAPAGDVMWEVGPAAEVVVAASGRAADALPAPATRPRDPARVVALDDVASGALGLTPRPRPPDHLMRHLAVDLRVPGEFLVKWDAPATRRAFEEAIAGARDAPWTTRPLAPDAATGPGAVRTSPSSARPAAGPADADEDALAATAHPLAAWSWVQRRDDARPPAPTPALALDDEDALKELRVLPGVLHVEPNRLWPVPGHLAPASRAVAAGRDAATASATAPTLAGATDLGALLDLPALHARTRGDGLVLAVVDTGLRRDLAPFAAAGALWINEAELHGAPGVDDDGNGYADDVFGWDFVSIDPAIAHPDEDAGPPDADPDDAHGHGTAVASVAAGSGGVAPGARLMGLRAGFALPSGQGVLSTADWVEAVAYAAAHGADVINLSFAGHEASEAARDVCAWAASRGCVVVAAAGNQSFYLPRYPAAFEGVVAVGSVGAGGARSSWSNFGAWVDLLGFGEAVEVAGLDGAPRLASGTSFAAPAVAGLAALARADGATGADDATARLRLAARDPYVANPAYAGQLGAGWPHAGSLAGHRAEEERGDVARVLMRNAGLTPAMLAPRRDDAWEAIPRRTEAEQRALDAAVALGDAAADDPLVLRPGEARLVELRPADGRPARDLLVAGAPPTALSLAPGTDETPPAVAFLRARAEADDDGAAPAPPPFDLLGARDAWAAQPFTPTPHFPWASGGFAWEEGAAPRLLLPARGPALAMAQGAPRMPPRGTVGDLHLVVLDDLAWPDDPTIDLRARLHAADWNAKTATWLYGADAATRRTARPARASFVVAEEAAGLAGGWRLGLDALRLADGPHDADGGGDDGDDGGGGGGASDPIALAVGAVRLEATAPRPSEPAWRLDARAVPDLAAGWGAIRPIVGDAPPATVEPAPPAATGPPQGPATPATAAGVLIATTTNAGSGGFVESPPVALEPGRLHRFRFRVATGERLSHVARAPVMLYAWRADHAQAWSRLVESQPGRSGWSPSPAPGWVELFVRVPAGDPPSAVRVGVGLWNRDPSDVATQSLRIEMFEAASVPDPWPGR